METEGSKVEIGEGCPFCSKGAFQAFRFRSIANRLVRCSACGLVYRNPPTPKEKLSEVYNSYYNFEVDKDYEEKIEKWFLSKDSQYQYAINFIRNRGGFKGKAALDVGCGLGRFLYECRKQGAIATGIDSHPRAISFVREHYGIEVIPKEFELAAREGDLMPASFDFVFAFELLEHYQNPRPLLSLLKSLLAPQGLLFVSVPNFQLDLLLKSAEDAAGEYPEHQLFFEPTTLGLYLERQGFKVVDTAVTNKFSYGSRQKQIMGRQRVVRSIWDKVKRIKFLYAMKDSIFKILDKHKQPIDEQGLSGGHLICIARLGD
jgi:2-polyprenyl-3-methyl-5-hydroxy-6-metoxy-1,4-benzoquinol methylase